MRKTYALVGLTLLLAGAAAAAGAEEAFEIVPVAEGVYAAIGKGSAPMFIGSNAAIIVNEDDVLVVDSHLTPSAAQALVEQIGGLTDKPVRYVVNTHWHNDHTQGNQAYANVFPGGVEYIAHHRTREDILTRAIPSIVERLRSMPQQIAEAEERLARGVDSESNALDDEQKEEQQQRLQRSKAYLEELKQIRITLPTMTFRHSLVLHKKARSIHILFFFKGHTRGDVVVYLPKEGVLVTGDLLTGGLPFPRDAYPAEWIKTFKAMAGLDFSKIIPGHGQVQEGREHLELVAEVFETLVSQVRAAVESGQSLEETQAAVDLSAFRDRVAGADEQRQRAFDRRVAWIAERAYLELTGKLDH